MDAASKEVLVASNGNSTESEIEAQNSHDIQVSADHLQLQGENHQSEGACSPLCFLSPCVGSASPGWLGGGQAAHAANSPIRRVIYGKYWKIICNLGGWTSPLYLAKKLRSGIHTRFSFLWWFQLCNWNKGSFDWLEIYL